MGVGLRHLQDWFVVGFTCEAAGAAAVGCGGFAKAVC